MNEYQKLWWEQAKSDHNLFQVLFQLGNIDECHLLHYLQMTTEKLAKAYLWRYQSAPPKSHKGFKTFLKCLLQNRRQTDQIKIAEILEFKNIKNLQGWTRSIIPIVDDLERLAPALANNGPNPEYPWPHDQPTTIPANYHFHVWKKLTLTGKGRHLLKVIAIVIQRFPELSTF